MADILIVGMEMPVSCVCCPLNYGEKRPEYGWTIVCRYSNGVVRPEMADNSGRLPTCGISELPPHGRLIDADKFAEAKSVNNIAIIMDLAEAQTIIPAEREEHND